MHINPPMLIPHFQPSEALIAGVKSGASSPIPLPPVLIIAAALPPRRPPNSTAVNQNEASQAPTAPIESANCPLDGCDRTLAVYSPAEANNAEPVTDAADAGGRQSEGSNPSTTAAPVVPNSKESG